jgi:hypothetical protein
LAPPYWRQENFLDYCSVFESDPTHNQHAIISVQTLDFVGGGARHAYLSLPTEPAGTAFLGIDMKPSGPLTQPVQLLAQSVAPFVAGSAFVRVSLVTDPFNPATMTWNSALALGVVTLADIIIDQYAGGTLTNPVLLTLGSISTGLPCIPGVPVYGIRLSAEPAGSINVFTGVAPLTAPNPLGGRWCAVCK